MADILDTSKSIYDILAEKRAMIETQRPDVARQLPVLGQATPGQRMQESAQNQPPQELADSLQAMIGAATQTVAGPQAKPKEQAAVGAEINDVLGYLNPLTPKRTYGPNIGGAMGMGENAGGILGLGIQPIDLLAFTIGAALTSNLPQDKAIATTMQLAGMPKAFRDNQEKSARAFVDDKIKQVGLQISGENLAERQMENAQKQSIIERRNAVLKMVGERLATGNPLNETEQRVIGVLGSGVVDAAMLKELTSPSIQQSWAAYQQLKGLAGDTNVNATFDGPGGSKFTIGRPGGSAGVETTLRTREILAAAREAGTPMTIAAAHKQALDEEVQLAGGKAKAVSENTPLPAPVQERIVRYDDLASQLQTLKDNYHPDFVGPVAYRSYNLRRQGLVPGAAMPSDKEVKFHQAQEYLQDIRLRVQSGAATSEPEAGRLLGTLPQGTDMPDVYNPGLTKAWEDTSRTIGRIKRNAITPKKEVGTSGATPSTPAPAPTQKSLPPPPQGWKY